MATTDWLEQFLRGNNRKQAALIAALGGEQKLGLSDPNHVAAAVANAPQPTGPAGSMHPSRAIPGSAVFVGRGMRSGTLGGPEGAATTPQFDRFSVERPDGRQLEAHDYGGGDIKFFKRKSNTLLDAAARLAVTKRLGHGQDAQAQQVAAMSPEDQERIRYLLGV